MYKIDFFTDILSFFVNKKGISVGLQSNFCKFVAEL